MEAKSIDVYIKLKRGKKNEIECNCNWKNCPSTSPSIWGDQTTGLLWHTYCLHRYDLLSKDRWRCACRCFSHVWSRSSVDLSECHRRPLLVMPHSKQAHLSLSTLHTTSYGWWIKLLLSCSLTIHFIHKPKILFRQAIGWEHSTQKDGVLPRQPMRGQ